MTDLRGYSIPSRKAIRRTPSRAEHALELVTWIENFGKSNSRQSSTEPLGTRPRALALKELVRLLGLNMTENDEERQSPGQD